MQSPVASGPIYKAAGLPAMTERSRSLPFWDFTVVCGLYNLYQKRRECDGGTLTLKFLAWMGDTQFQLTFCCLHLLTQPHLIEGKLGSLVFPHAQGGEENRHQRDGDPTTFP